MTITAMPGAAHILKGVKRTPPPALPLCVGKHELFDSVDSLAHDQAAKLCRSCPALEWCKQRANELNTSGKTGSFRPLTGTWAATLYGANPGDDSRFATEEAMFTDDEARVAHAAWGRGVRDNDRVRVGERVYQRRAGKRKRERRAAAA